MVDISYISAFLNKDGVEGPRQTVGYIPASPGNFYGRKNQIPSRYKAIGASGVTIATGCDLGQTDVDTLDGYGLDARIIQKVKPYIGLKTDAAIAKLSKMPLEISAADAAALDHAVHAGYLKRYVIPAYNKASDVDFANLPKQAQAAVFSICFQLGCGGARRNAPKTWGFLTTQNWKAASKELKYGFNSYGNRRCIEGMLLEELL